MDQRIRSKLEADSYCKSSKELKTVYYCMQLDDGHMTETCCGSNNRGGEEGLLLN
jgi:hypothetical protein